MKESRNMKYTPFFRNKMIALTFVLLVSIILMTACSDEVVDETSALEVTINKEDTNVDDTPEEVTEDVVEVVVEAEEIETPEETIEVEEVEEVIKSPDDTRIVVIDRQLYLEGQPFFIQGVCWNPVGKGDTHPSGIDFSGFVEQDAKLMADAGINAIRTYEVLLDETVLDILYEHGIYVINTVYIWGGADVTSVINHVNAVKDHPAILMWSLGNEWNYNGLYVGDSNEVCVDKINEAARLIKEIDTSHPISTVYGHVPSRSIIDRFPDIDVWGLNVYSGISFGNIFRDWETRSDKPMYMAEYGADAWNANTGLLDEEAQGKATYDLTKQLIDHSTQIDPEGVCIGGTIFEFADEWWKDGGGTADQQDVGGIAPGGGPYPDSTFNEEYWGIVDIDRNPRPAYDMLKLLYIGDQ